MRVRVTRVQFHPYPGCRQSGGIITRENRDTRGSLNDTVVPGGTGQVQVILNRDIQQPPVPRKLGDEQLEEEIFGQFNLRTDRLNAGDLRIRTGIFRDSLGLNRCYRIHICLGTGRHQERDDAWQHESCEVAEWPDIRFITHFRDYILKWEYDNVIDYKQYGASGFRSQSYDCSP